MTNPIDALRLPSPIVLVPGRQLATKLVAGRQQFPYLPEPAALLAELNRLTANGGVPATLDASRQGSRWLRLYVARAVVGLRPSPRNDAWVIEFLDPMRLRDHRTISRGILRLAPPAWYYQAILAQLPPGNRSFQAEIEYAWASLGSTPQARATTPAAPSRYEEYCADLEEVIEAGRQIDSAKQRQAPPIPYYAVDSAAEQRRRATGVYVFRLARPGGVEKGTLVELRNAPDLRGTVLRVDGDRLTVRFAGTVHRPRITEQGELVMSFNPVVPRVQQDAVRLLRAGGAVNPQLLPLLVDGAFPQLPPQLTIEAPTPAEPLDPDQTVAFERALTKPDLLLVLGPPGTGKTRTIVQIAQGCAARGERVLVTSQTNTAVDNVLERLPTQVRGLRVGNDDRISAAVRHQTLPVVAANLQKQILDNTAANASALRPWLIDPSPADAWLAQLGRALGDVRQAQAHREAAERQRRTDLMRVQARYQPRLDAGEAAVATAKRARDTASGRAEHFAAKLARARRREQGWLGFAYRPIARRRAERLAVAERDTSAAAHVLATAEQDLAEVNRELSAAVAADPRVREAQQWIQSADAALARTVGEAARAAGALHRLLAAVLPVRNPAPDEPSGLAEFHQWCQQIQPLVRARAVLLNDWRTKLAEPTDELHHELVRYADVVGATCIGVAVGSNLVADLEFDVAIVDEAGQISLPSALVPLVRARRAILVGDHHQLPPFVDDEVREWLTHRAAGAGSLADPRRLIDLLTTSAFERLYRTAPEAHRVLLREQRRMPAAIADFVSAQFYGDQLRTVGIRPPAPPPFRRPLAIVDTSDLPADKRAERERQRTETWQAAGCDNPAEARLIIDLVQWYARTGRTWAVIVPYRAQVQLLTARLSTMLGDETLVADNVGTVDAFQGGERDIICYGFTRSNAARQIGFLRELRRINVAITRAQQQLVLVGDFTTLRTARHHGFRELIQALDRHAAQHGEVHRSAALPDLLRDVWTVAP